MELLCNPPKKSSWKQSVIKQINSYWIDRIKCSTKLYSSLQNIAVDNYACGRCHHLLKSTKNMREVQRIHTKLRIATGTYILQVNRASFNQNKVDPSCMLCRNGEETLRHFLLDCSALSVIRNPITDNILDACRDLCNPAYVADNLLQLVVDCSMLIDQSTDKHELMNIEFHCRRLCFSLNCERYKRLAVIPRRIRTVKAKKAQRGTSQQSY